MLYYIMDDVYQTMGHQKNIERTFEAYDEILTVGASSWKATESV